MAARLEAEKFTGKNDYGLWKMKMRAVLVQQGLAAVLTSADSEEKGKTPALDEKAQAKLDEMQLRAHSAVILCLGDKVLREVQGETTASGILKKLDEVYLAKSLANRLYMKRRLYSYSFSDDKSIVEQLEDFSKSIDDLEAVDVKISDEDKAILVLNALPSSYDQLRDAILYGRDKAITLNEVHAALMAKELQKGASKVNDSHPESLNIKKFNKKKFKKKVEEAKVENSGAKETRSCHWCKKPGHLKKDCYAWKKKQASESQSHTNVISSDGDEAAEVMNVVDRIEKNSWIMDSGCSFHMCPHLEWFQDLAECSGSVLLGNENTCSIRGVGSIKLRMNDGSLIILSEVRFIPEVKRNLVSLGTLERKGYCFVSENGEMKVCKGQDVKMVAKRAGSLYYLQATVITGESHSVVKNDLSSWHQRLGHPAEGTLKAMISKKVVEVGSTARMEKCEDCLLGKAKKLSFPAGNHTSTSPLDYIHSDLWGPSQVKSLGGGKYYMSIIDDFSRKVWVYILKEKSEAFTTFKTWCKEMENEKGIAPKVLRTDNGLEYLSKDFDAFCLEKGIRRHRTVPANPQQNGVAERMNRTLLERVRCLLSSSGAGKHFWAETVSTAAYLINKCPSSGIGGSIPDERWYGTKPDYSRLKPFGCKAFAHLKQGKLNARALQCVMIGYQKGVKGYRLWCIEPGNNKILISRDVVFIEDNMPLLKKKAGVEAADSGHTQAEALADIFPDDGKSASDEDDEIQGDQIGTDGTQQHHQSPSPQEYQIARDRPRRANVKVPARFNDYEMLYYALHVAEEIELAEPSSYAEAVSGPERELWIQAMKEEFESLISNKTWVLVEKAEFRKIVGCKWVYKKKIESAGSQKIRFKARLVAKGFNQQEGIDFNEVYSPVVKHNSIRVLLAVVAKRDWELEQLDVKTAFLNGELEETIYMAQPLGFEVHGSEHKVCMLKRSIYGLKQSSRQWYIKFGESLAKLGFCRSLYDSCVFVKKQNKKAPVYLLLYVDDMLLSGPDVEEVRKVKMQLKANFEMKDLGNARKILGMDIVRDRSKKKLWLFQTDYIQKTLKKFRVENMKKVATPMAMHFKLSSDQKAKTDEEKGEMELIPYSNIVGSLMYMMICTRPDIAHAISTTSRYMAGFGRQHWSALKWTLRYLGGADKLAILFTDEGGADGEPLVGFCDSDYAANLDTRRSQTGYIFTLFGSAICWKSSLQNVVALSTTEAEYIALTSAVKESKWLLGLVSEFGVEQKSVAVHCDNSGALCLARHQMFHERSKHIDVRLHFIRDEVESGRVKVIKIDTAHNPADMLTKPLSKDKFDYCCRLVSLYAIDF